MFTVTWTNNAVNGLTASWLHSESNLRSRINSAVIELEKRLRADAGIGESRMGNLRVVFEQPLGVEIHGFGTRPLGPSRQSVVDRVTIHRNVVS